MAEFELKIKNRDFNTLITKIKENRPDADFELITKAYNYAEKAHKDQFRLSGEPYIVHPLEVGIILASLKMDTPTIIAALLHDVVEDTVIPLQTIEKEFSNEIAQLVDGVTKISSLKKKTKYHEQAQTLRKMLIATIDDARVIIIKLADKTHNMRTIMFHSKHKQERIANEVLEIYAPLAGRLGMSKIRSQLEDLAFHVLHPQEFKAIKENLAARTEEINKYIEETRNILHEKIKELNIKAQIHARIKHYYSIFRKMKNQKKTFEEIFDIRAIRIISEQIKDCYAVLGVVHTLWSPIPSRFKDYIAVPKSNMYQSLHTTVIGPNNHFLEIQIRTQEMHITAEMGIAAHWSYKEKSSKQKPLKKEIALLKDISRWRSNIKDTREFMKGLKMDLYEEEIFVFTPKGKIINLGKGSSAIDFAYAIHTEVGNHCVGAKINNRLSPLRTILKSGDIIEITTSPKGHPSDAWLKYVKSSNARYKVRSWLKKRDAERNENRSTDKSQKETQKNEKNEQVIEVSIPEIELNKIKKYNKKHKTNILVDGNSNVLIKLSQCCQPIPGDKAVGFITRGRGITIHKISCPSLKKLAAEKDRFIEIVWGESRQIYPVKIAIEANDRQHLIKDIAENISSLNTNIIKLEAQTAKNKNAVLKLVIEVKSLDHMNIIIQSLKNIKNVNNAYKLNEKVMIK
jgi:GTP pyrophosphokinase